MGAVILAAPGPVFLDPSVQTVHSNATITSSSSSIFTGIGASEVSLFINTKASPTGTAPTLQYTIQEVDPGDGVTIIGSTVSSTVINTIQIQRIALLSIYGGSIKVSWTITGSASPTFTQVYATLTANIVPHQLTDGVNGPAAVKAASTAVVASDLALAVSLSPNSHIKGTIQPLYGTSNQTITITLASLGSSATAARQSTAVDNTSNLYEDVVVFVKIKTGASAVSATGYVNIYGYGTADGGTTYPEAISGTDGSLTLAAPSNLILLAQLTANANATTYSALFSFCNNYGLSRLPQKWGIVIANVSGAALDSTAGNHAVFYQGINGQLV